MLLDRKRRRIRNQYYNVTPPVFSKILSSYLQKKKILEVGGDYIGVKELQVIFIYYYLSLFSDFPTKTISFKKPRVQLDSLSNAISSSSLYLNFWNNFRFTENLQR